VVNEQAQYYGQKQALVAGASGYVTKVLVSYLNQLFADLKLFLMSGRPLLF
jgi:hypothetical protein